MRSVKVALLQMVSCGSDLAANLAKGDEWCRRAKMNWRGTSQEGGADIALFPEMWSIGYTLVDHKDPVAVEGWQRQAIDRDGEFVTHFQRLAKELDMAIALTYLEKWEGGPRNTMSLIDRHGEIAMTYAKVHTCDFDKEAACTPGDDFYVCSLDTAAGAVKVGAMICFDREFPESARVLMLKGAELILVPNACTMSGMRMSQLRVRAYENMVGIALTNYAAPQDDGHSVAFDPVLTEFDDGPEIDNLIIEAGRGEGIFIAEFDMDRIRSYREREGWGNSYRKPRAYGILASGEVAPPFVRADARR
jgi:predicted amidohydrolase